MLDVRLTLQPDSLRGFIDYSRVERSVARAKRRVLMKAGAFIRQRARSSIRKRKKISGPGAPPSSHTDRLRGNILFAMDGDDTVLIGPAPRGGVSKAPRLLEYGGDAPPAPGRKKSRHYRARPFMGPALMKELPKLSAMWAGAVRG